MPSPRTRKGRGFGGMNVQKNYLQLLLGKARALDSPHVDLSDALGLSEPLLVEVDALHKIVQLQSPVLKITYEDAYLTAEVTGGLAHPDGMTFAIGVAL